eukprot:TRINITY_DN129_c0_g1_i1.p1 TRINITY_DN129_c0_g1~~TRINITY_DN129_c0_g1_i1.p1  ORF type:complete len:336 (-),score=66.21 TRINITY_DN129_c0_g1_i1:92-949(-)
MSDAVSSPTVSRHHLPSPLAGRTVRPRPVVAPVKKSVPSKEYEVLGYPLNKLGAAVAIALLGAIIYQAFYPASQLSSQIAPFNAGTYYSPKQILNPKEFAYSCGDMSCNPDADSVCLTSGSMSRCVDTASASAAPANQTEADASGLASFADLASPSGSFADTVSGGAGCALGMSVSSRRPGSDDSFIYQIDELTFSNTGSRDAASVDMQIVLPNSWALVDTFAMEKTCCDNIGSVANFKINLHDTPAGQDWGTATILYRIAVNGHWGPGAQQQPLYVMDHKMCQQ